MENILASFYLFRLHMKYFQYQAANELHIHTKLGIATKTPLDSNSLLTDFEVERMHKERWSKAQHQFRMLLYAAAAFLVFS